jgi:hypothetical protein
MNIDQAAREILGKIRAKVDAGNDGGIYGDRAKALHEIDALLSDPSIFAVKLLLAPTANLQELSIENGWGAEFLDLSSQLERVLDLS